MSFNALEDVATQTQTHKSLFIGDTTGLNPNSVVGQMVDIALSASQASGKDSGRLAGLDGAAAAGMGAQVGLEASRQVKSVSSLFEKGDTPEGNIDLIAVQSNIGFDLEKSSTTLTTGTVQGSTAAAGNTLAVTATGGVPTDSQSGNIVATASQLSGQDVTLTAPGQVTLQAGYDTTHEVASSKSIEASVGPRPASARKGRGQHRGRIWRLEDQHQCRVQHGGGQHGQRHGQRHHRQHDRHDDPERGGDQRRVD
ncbi:hemagglutinin repeat-containing protein [Komagataeibacter rhaeticus]|nr:hemagglutinin repeat-containing protein [Komagataeibacter rhaeticus]